MQSVADTQRVCCTRCAPDLTLETDPISCTSRFTQVNPEDTDSGAPGKQQAKREVINRIRRTLSETLECE